MLPGRGTPLGAVEMSLGWDLVSLQLPGLREGCEGRPGLLEIMWELVAKSGIDVFRHDRAEPVQNLVTLIAGLDQPLRGVPHLRRVVGSELVRDDVVHGEVPGRAGRP